MRGRGRYLHSTHHFGHGIIIPPTDEDIEVQRAGLAQGHSSACQSHCHSTLQLTPESFGVLHAISSSPAAVPVPLGRGRATRCPAQGSRTVIAWPPLLVTQRGKRQHTENQKGSDITPAVSPAPQIVRLSLPVLESKRIPPPVLSLKRNPLPDLSASLTQSTCNPHSTKGVSPQG